MTFVHGNLIFTTIIFVPKRTDRIEKGWNVTRVVDNVTLGYIIWDLNRKTFFFEHSPGAVLYPDDMADTWEFMVLQPNPEGN